MRTIDKIHHNIKWLIVMIPTLLIWNMSIVWKLGGNWFLSYAYFVFGIVYLIYGATKYMKKPPKTCPRCGRKWKND